MATESRRGGYERAKQSELLKRSHPIPFTVLPHVTGSPRESILDAGSEVLCVPAEPAICTRCPRLRDLEKTIIGAMVELSRVDGAGVVYNSILSVVSVPHNIPVTVPSSRESYTKITDGITEFNMRIAGCVEAGVGLTEMNGVPECGYE